MLKKAKEKTGLKVYELADFLKVSKPTLHNWEKNENWPLWALRKCNLIEE